MELRQLQCLVACAQTKSFSRAASLLFTSQSNVSKMIAALENELGKKLFERKSYGIELTEKGKQVYQYAQNMLECSAKIVECMEEEEIEELRVSFQPSSWFASAFCDYYIQYGAHGKRFKMTSASAEGIIRRIADDLDHLGFAYIEDSQLARLSEVFRANHIGYYVLKETKTVLYYGGKTDKKDMKEVPLIQGNEDLYSGISLCQEKNLGEEKKSQEFHVMITTNSDYIMQEILQRTELSNISPAHLSHREKTFCYEMRQLGEWEQEIQFICMFRNDRTMEKMAKEFLAFMKKYINEKE